jgi:hypothetical protein
MPSKSELALKWPVFQPRFWGTPGKGKPLPRPWFGLDTERDAKNGKFVCGFAVGETTQEFKLMLDLVPGTYWIWNLGYDIEAMIRDYQKEEGWAMRQDGARFPFLGGEARYFHGKRFDFKRDGERWSFIEAASFFGRCPLAKIGKKYGQKEGVKASEMSLSRYVSDPGYQEQVDSYCRQDARIVYNAVTDLDLGVGALGVDLGGTPGATARRFLARLGKFPDILWQTQKHFLKSYCGGRFEITKRGVLFNVFQYDIVSAYPWALAQCPWLTGKAIQKWGRRFSDNALYGTYRVKFKFDDYLGIAPRWRKGIRVYSKGQEDTWLARPEVDWLLRNGADVEILQSLEVFDENATNLWAEVIAELFVLKNTANACHKKLGRPCGKEQCPECDEKFPESIGAKIILNSMYGVLIQLVRRNGEWVLESEAVNPVDWAGVLALEDAPREFEGGKYYAPLYAGNLTSLTRVKLLDAARAVGNGYIGGHTDSVLSTRELPGRFLGRELGDFKLEKKAFCANVRGTGLYSMDNAVKIRGITRQGTPAMLWQNVHERRSRCGIKSAKTWEEVSLIRPKTVANNWNVENKRIWEKELTLGMIEGKEFIDSEALIYV